MHRNDISFTPECGHKESTQQSVAGEFNYVGSNEDTLIYFTDQPDRTMATWEPHVFPVHDMRLAKAPPSLEREGFTMAKLPLEIGSATDAASVAEIYHPDLEKLIGRLTGAPKIFMQGSIMRWSDRVPSHPDVENSGTSSFVHSDYDRDVFLDISDSFIANDPEADRWRNGRRAIIQTWRSLSPPPQDRPLAVLDRRTIRSEDLARTRTVVGREGNEQEFWQYTYRYNPEHEWSYISNMTSDDVLVFVGFDTEMDGLAGIPHQSFDLTKYENDCIPRWSYEVRAFVYWG